MTSSAGSIRQSTLKGPSSSQSDNHWNCFKGNLWELSVRWDGAHYMGFPECVLYKYRSIQSWTELMSKTTKILIDRQQIPSIALAIKSCKAQAVNLSSWALAYCTVWWRKSWKVTMTVMPISSDWGNSSHMTCRY